MNYLVDFYSYSIISITIQPKLATNTHANMESCWKLLPKKSYNKFGYIVLASFVLIGIVIIGIATAFNSKATLQCNPDKTLASDLSTRKYIETLCLLKYTREFHPSLPIYVLIIINFGLVLLLCVFYAWWVKDRVEIFADPPSATTNDAEDECQQFSGISRAASDPMAHQNFVGGYFVFKRYIMHLILCRIIPLAGFAVFLLRSSNFPVQYHCPWPTKSTSSPHVNFTQSQTTSYSVVDCTYPMGNKIEQIGTAVVTINFLFSTVAFVELAHLLWSTWKDTNLCTDLEFCCVYLLRKRKRIRKLMKKVRENISSEIFTLYDDFGEKRLSRRKLEEIYVNVLTQEGRESTFAYRKKFKDRHETYEAHFKLPQDATTFKRTTDLFEPKRASEKRPRTILVVGRPGIGKTLLTKKILYEWQQQTREFWRSKIVILIRFRAFNKGPTSLREMLRCSDGLNTSSADFNCIYEYICLIPSNVILVFDGLDELKVNSEFFADERFVKGYNEVSHILMIFKQLVKGELLPGATVLTTSRPTAEHIYQQLKFDREVEVLGFHEKQIEEYVEMFCRNDMQKSSEIWNLIKESPELLSLCYIPVNSYIVCLTLKESVKTEDKSDIPRTITELYKRAINILLFRHHIGYKDKSIPKNYIIAKLPNQLQNDLNQLKRIATNGMIADQITFEFQNDDEFVDTLSDCGLFNKLEDKRQNIFCFLHLTIQEFLAALHVVDDMDNVESFLTKHIGNPRWHLVIQFVAGLIGDKMRELEEERNLLEWYF